MRTITYTSRYAQTNILHKMRHLLLLLSLFSLISCKPKPQINYESFDIIETVISNDDIYSDFTIYLGKEIDETIFLQNLYMIDEPNGLFDLEQDKNGSFRINYEGRLLKHISYSDIFCQGDSTKFSGEVIDRSYYQDIPTHFIHQPMISFIDIPTKSNNDSSEYNISIDFEACHNDSIGGFFEFSYPIINCDSSMALTASRTVTEGFLIESFYSLSKDDNSTWIIESTRRFVYSMFSFDFYMDENGDYEARVGVVYLGSY
jgi:hypothetical protein